MEYVFVGFIGALLGVLGLIYLPPAWRLSKFRNKQWNRFERWEIHQDSPARRRTKRLAGQELHLWAEATAMNMQYHISKYISDGDVTHLDEALMMNDILCAMLLEQQARAVLGL